MNIESPKYRLILGTLGWFVLLFMAIWSIITGNKPDATIVTTLGSASTFLLGLGIVKQHKSFQNVQ